MPPLLFEPITKNINRYFANKNGSSKNFAPLVSNEELLVARGFYKAFVFLIPWVKKRG